MAGRQIGVNIVPIAFARTVDERKVADDVCDRFDRQSELIRGWLFGNFWEDQRRVGCIVHLA